MSYESTQDNEHIIGKAYPGICYTKYIFIVFGWIFLYIVVFHFCVIIVLVVLPLLENNKHHFKSIWCGRLDHETSLTPSLFLFYWSACTKLGKWTVIYLYVRFLFCLFLRFFYCILELFRLCSILWYFIFFYWVYSIWKRTKNLSHQMRVYMIIYIL